MKTWKDPKQLVEFEALLDCARGEPESVSDDALVAKIRETYWATNAWCWVEMSLAVISAACAARPHLWAHVIGDPIEAMIAGGLENDGDVIAQGIALARKSDPYVPLTDDSPH